MKFITLLFAFLLAFTFSGYAQDDDCADVILEAQKGYDLGKFQEVIDDLNECLPSIEDVKGQIKAHELLAYSYSAFDATDKVRGEIYKILGLKSDYDSDRDAPLLFSLMVDEIKQDIADDLTSAVSKKDEKIELVPASIEVITEEEIFRRGYRSLEELFHDISGFDITSTKGEQYSLLYQRGYRSDLGDRTLVLVNGVEDNGLYTNEAHITRQYPISNIERVEVIYGPATTMYGANAFQGVINIVTKNAKQLTTAGNSIGANAHVGYGHWNTRMVDATIAGHKRKAGFSITGRVFTSDEMDLSKNPNYHDFDYRFDQGFENKDYDSALSFSATGKPGLLSKLESKDAAKNLYFIDGDRVRPTQLAIRRARGLDSTSYTKPFLSPLDTTEDNRDLKLVYANPTQNYYVQGKFNFENLNVGFQLWQKKEGQGGLVTDRFFASGDGREADLTSWQIRHLTLYTQYEAKISDKVTISNLGTFKNFAHFPSLRQTTFKGYVNGRNGEDDNGLLQLIDSEPSSWTQEFNFLRSKQFKNELNALFTLNSNLDIVSGFEVRFGAIPQQFLKIESIDGNAFAHLDAVMAKGIPGGNMVHSNEFGLFAQGSYRSSDSLLRLSFGARTDYNVARDREARLQRKSDGFGYGFKVNPRLALVYNPTNFVFKAIYASAFLNPSNFQRFGSSAGRVPNDSLETEKVHNIDIAARWNLKEDSRSYIELIGYHARYNNAIQTRIRPNGKLRFEQVSGLSISGLQLNAKYRIDRGGFYGNYTFTLPFIFKENSDNIRVGDIASSSFNMGSFMDFFDGLLTADIRTNYVGKRRTGSETTVKDNPIDTVQAYQIFDGALTLNGAALTTNDKGFLAGLRVQFVMNNILNKEYFHPGARAADGIILTSTIPQETRHYFLKLQYRW